MTTATPAGLSRYIHSSWLFRSLGNAIIADGVAGLVGASLAAFGAVGGICHGIAEKDNFSVNHWKKTQGSGGGSKSRIYLPEIDLFLDKNQTEILLQKRGAKSLLACNDPSCCVNNPQGMIHQHKAHALTQSVRLINDFNQAQENRWVDHLA